MNKVDMANILDGKATAAAVREDVAAGVEALRAAGHPAPGLCVVLVGEDPASQVYVRNKDRAATQAGFEVATVRLAAETSQADLEAEIDRLNLDPGVHGILVQLPLPKGLDADNVLRRLDPAKDVDGLTATNVAALVTGSPGHVPCTPAGCIEILDRHGIALEGKRVTIVGRSMLVGKPLAQLALARNATVTVCHSRTADLAGECRQADVLVAAVGVARLIKGDWIQPGATVLDVGINRGEDGKLVGDVDFEEAVSVAGAITPVPGGVGPMTIAMLLKNTLSAARAAVGVQGP
ncbi:bifunctional methylenetetrahydrofolate dehydrogenase/methenyltetrahydrofolate cyclohydrolase FolD [Candidatus Woesearchaeota archaeon]|jgi:methylenetetrahydrofolate dehydrogenase (NADP+)/methenyltetrahydrofolate cyclohydrolase|nr:bifunctional methylenetetrahydrofolate dehydrogenase/methenyltetrahydrofolate cyclohydrolase FolD [Candidatus Woesearchaeota archaeon]MDP6739699.1 bifunctional methylenetetrahydrofolate dehydrogenase/methenyltetrahydrofolate cyclohydrolase FolD [Planctomycetota bacterium]MDP6938865.1 bifunctional methylenetetrahydrofolate dehydrogenase/methenyltetrahydrofolate cyclohydrolase FolD [Planctomycetota bacterium]